MRCRRCGSELAAGRLSCPACQQLVHSERLKELAASADAATARGEFDLAAASWKEALELLPPGSRQAQAVAERLQALEDQRRAQEGAAQPADARHGSWQKIGVGVGAVGLLLWKLKAVVAIVLSKGKLLLLGLAKWPMLFGAVASFGVFWSEWGWRFALGLMVSLYLHELGHVAALRWRGIPASAPMFVPGLGAYVRLKRPPSGPLEDAIIGLAGPLAGLAAAAAAWLVFLTTGWGTWGAIARFGAWINVFNLLPVWQLDGARGFAALDRLQRVLVVAATLALYAMTREGLLVLVAVVGGYRALVFEGPERGDWRVWSVLVLLLVSLGALSVIDVPV